MGPLSVSPMGFGTWAWGNQLLWGYQTSMDDQLQQAFELALENGINLFDTADSYGTGRLNGQSERLLGKFIKESQGVFLFNLSQFCYWSKDSDSIDSFRNLGKKLPLVGSKVLSWSCLDKLLWWVCVL
jgi:diketogulonate reductase-like aldo/keto reductase